MELQCSKKATSVAAHPIPAPVLVVIYPRYISQPFILLYCKSTAHGNITPTEAVSYSPNKGGAQERIGLKILLSISNFLTARLLRLQGMMPIVTVLGVPAVGSIHHFFA